MSDLRTAAQQALEALEDLRVWRVKQSMAVIALRAALAQQDEPVTEDMKSAVRWAPSSAYWSQQLRRLFGPDAREGIDTLERRLAEAQQAEPKGGGNLPPPLPVPPEVAATLTTADIAWLATYRLTRLWTELGQMRWVGVDKGWDLAIEAVRRRLDAECQDVMAWKARADQSGATAAELLQKMQRL